jgi:hypothetical protein
MNKPATVFVIGSGAVVNAWDPIVEAVHEVYEQVRTGDQANVALSNIVYNLRWWHHAQLEDLYHIGTVSQECVEPAKAYRSSLEQVCRQIASSVERAEQTTNYRLRDEFDVVWNLAVGTAGAFEVVTTNWDRLVANHVGQRWPELADEIFHIHGDRRDAATLFLPTEVAFEPYRPPDIRRNAQKRHNQIMKLLERAERLVIYGLSLSSDDAELSNLIAVGLDQSNVSQIEIVDPQHALTAGRVMALLHGRQPTVWGRSPSQLGGPTRYLWP